MLASKVEFKKPEKFEIALIPHQLGTVAVK